MKEGRKPEYPEKTPGDKLRKMPHTNDSLWEVSRRNDYVDDIRDQLVLHDAVTGGGGSQGRRSIHLITSRNK